MSVVAYFSSATDKNFSTRSPESVIHEIQSGVHAEQVQYLWNLGINEYKEEKKRLPAVTWSGTFAPGTRSIESMTGYSKLIVIDIDKLEITAINELKNRLRSDQFVRYCFCSPSYKGIKIVVEVNTDKNQHRHAWLHLQKYFEGTYAVKVDATGKDCSRLCFMSWDQEAIINPSSQVFVVDSKYGDIQTEFLLSADMREQVVTAERIFQVAVKWLERHYVYTEGQRNHYLFCLACILNRFGVQKNIAIAMIDQHYTTPDRLWEKSIDGAYFRNQNEHGTIPLRDATRVGVFNSTTAINEEQYSQNESISDLIRIASLLMNYKVPYDIMMDLCKKVLMYYNQQGYLALRESKLVDLIGAARNSLQAINTQSAESMKLPYQTPAEIATEMVNMDFLNGIKTYIQAIDDATGGLHAGNVYGLIGYGETFKSITAEFIAYKNAMDGVAVLFLNGEMSRMQYMERLSQRCLNKSFRQALKGNFLNKETIESFNDLIMEATNSNLFTFSGVNFNKVSILATIEHIFLTTGKKIQLVVMDSISQMDQLGREEASANIENSKVAKEIVKEANRGEGVTMLMLSHCSGKENKLIRNTGQVVRGGSKLITNMDGYFSTSLFIDPAAKNEDNPDDVNYLEGKFCLRYNDKRGGTGTHYVVCNVAPQLMIETELTDYRQYEVKS